MVHSKILLDLYGLYNGLHTAVFEDFIDFEESICGLGSTQIEAVENLMKQVRENSK